jgi:hypothetical protein
MNTIEELMELLLRKLRLLHRCQQVLMHHQRHNITVNEETFRPLTDPHSAEIRPVQQLASSLERIDQYRRILRVLITTADSIKGYVLDDSTENMLEIADDLPHIVPETLHTIFQSPLLTTATLQRQYLSQPLCN